MKFIDTKMHGTRRKNINTSFQMLRLLTAGVITDRQLGCEGDLER